MKTTTDNNDIFGDHGLNNKLMGRMPIEVMPGPGLVRDRAILPPKIKQPALTQRRARLTQGHATRPLADNLYVDVKQQRRKPQAIALGDIPTHKINFNKL